MDHLDDLVHDHRHGCERVDTADSRPHAGGARQGGHQAMVERRSQHRALRPAPDERLRMWPVSRRVNKTETGDDDPTLIDEVAT